MATTSSTNRAARRYRKLGREREASLMEAFADRTELLKALLGRDWPRVILGGKAE